VKQLKIPFDEIQKAMEDVVRDNFDYFLILDTGEVITFSDEILQEVQLRLYDNDSDEIDDAVEYIEFDDEPDIPDWMGDEVELALEILLDEEGRFIRIPERTSAMAYQSMASFIETVDDQRLKEQLAAALNGKGAFRKFKDILIPYPKERKRWHGFNAQSMKRDITGWLHSIGIKPALHKPD
jgi:hypothetical protein